jgi:hypothetical protein
MKKIVLIGILISAPAVAEPMHFEAIRNGGNCAGCSYTQATGEITSETAARFEAFAESQQFRPGLVRLNSPGGDLIGGVALGEAFRRHDVLTEVGGSAPLVNATEPGLADRAPGVCASACAYAFLGGTERSLDDDSKLGFHRFYQRNALMEPSAKIFTGQDLDHTQKLTAALVFYVVKMGVDARLITLAAAAGPNEVYWIGKDEARELRVTYEPWAYKPWQVEPYRGGAVAVTTSADGTKSMVVSCSSKLGPNVSLINAKPTWDVGSWFDQCSKLNLPGGLPVFGTRVDPSRIQVIHRKDGAVVMRFQLPTANPPLSSPSLLSFEEGYPRACSTNEYLGSTESFVPAVRLAFRNCFQD